MWFFVHSDFFGMRSWRITLTAQAKGIGAAGNENYIFFCFIINNNNNNDDNNNNINNNT